jgi:hypothetical protein
MWENGEWENGDEREKKEEEKKVGKEMFVDFSYRL